MNPGSLKAIAEGFEQMLAKVAAEGMDADDVVVLASGSGQFVVAGMCWMRIPVGTQAVEAVVLLGPEDVSAAIGKTLLDGGTVKHGEDVKP